MDSFFKNYQEITPEQFKKLSLSNETLKNKSKQYTTILNGKPYFVIIYKEKYFISRKPTTPDSTKWIPIHKFNDLNKYKKETIEQKTKTGSSMFTLTCDEVQYIGFVTDDGKEYVSTTNKIIF